MAGIGKVTERGKGIEDDGLVQSHEAKTVESLRGCMRCHDVEQEGHYWRPGQESRGLRLPIWLIGWRYQFEVSNSILIEASWKMLSRGVTVITYCVSYAFVTMTNFPVSCGFLFNWMYSWIVTSDPNSLPCGQGGRSASPLSLSGADWRPAVLLTVTVPDVPEKSLGNHCAFHSQSFLTPVHLLC